MSQRRSPPHLFRTHARHIAAALLLLIAFAAGGWAMLNAASAQPDAPDPTLAALLSLQPARLAEETVTPVVALPPLAPTPNPVAESANQASPLFDPGELDVFESPLTSPNTVTSSVHLPLILHNYEAPPRPPEAFVLLPDFPRTAWPAAQDQPARSKIGLMALGTGDPFVMEFIRRTKPAVVKSVGDIGWLTEVKQVSPSTTTIGRLVYEEAPEQREWLEVVDPAQAAQLYMERHLEQFQLNPGVDYWEGWNEFVPVYASWMRWYAQFEAERACLMQAHGFRAAVGGFSTGVPEYDMMGEFLPALEAAQRCGGLFHLHEYNRPLLQCGVHSGLANIIPGAPKMYVPAGPLVLRYRFWYYGYLYPNGLGDVPLVISELGIDAVPVIDCPQPTPSDARAWKDLAGWWANQNYGSTGEQAYVNQLAWLDREMQHDPFVIGATIFTTSATGSGNIWNRYDIHDVLMPLAHYLVSRP